MKRGVHGRFLDQSTSVREAAIELLGKFILIRPELIPQYYDMLSERILVRHYLLNPFSYLTIAARQCIIALQNMEKSKVCF